MERDIPIGEVPHLQMNMNVVPLLTEIEDLGLESVLGGHWTFQPGVVFPPGFGATDHRQQNAGNDHGEQKDTHGGPDEFCLMHEGLEARCRRDHADGR